MKIYYYIYLITNKINDKIYIGQRQSFKMPEKDSYFGSGVLLKKAIKKYGRQNFEKEIIQLVHSKEELDNAEIAFIKYCKSNNREIGYNVYAGGLGGSPAGKDHPMFGKRGILSPIYGRKNPGASEYLKIKNPMFRAEVREKVSGKNNARFGKTHSEETRRKIAKGGLTKLRKKKGDSPYPYGIRLYRGKYRVDIRVSLEEKDARYLGSFKTLEEAIKRKAEFYKEFNLLDND